MVWGDDVNITLLEKSKNFIAIWVQHKADCSEWLCIGVYGDPGRDENQAIWDRLDQLMEIHDGPACLMGDFNAISSNEKEGGNSSFSTNNREFRQWIHGSGLIDMGYQGPAYTWSNKQGAQTLITERLDRVLVNLQWHQNFPKASIFHLPRFSSDHMPILLRMNSTFRNKPLPFRCEAWWSLDVSFQSLCQNLTPQKELPWPDLQKEFKSRVKKWQSGMKSPPKMLADLESQMAQLNSTPRATANAEKEKEIQEQHQTVLAMNEYYWFQRARVNWILSGDNNTRYFHATAVARKRRNAINAIQSDIGNWVAEPKEITRMFVAHFKSIYRKRATSTISQSFPLELLAQLPKIPSYMTDSLDSDPSELEIKAALMSLCPTKAPGPDGLSAQLLQQNWETFGPSIIKEVKSFFETGVMKAEIARTNLVLIPKLDHAIKVEHFRPISVCNVLYKTISKILTFCLKPFIGDCISPAQSAFVPGRDIAENVILLREVMHSFKMRGYKNQEFCLKADLSKAFDRMDWDYLTEHLPLYGLPPKLTKWILSCVTSATFIIVLNGSGGSFFSPECGLRQGCSLSLYLFILGMDLLSRSLQFEAKKGMLRGVRLGVRSQPLTNCAYADDLLLFGSCTEAEASKIMESLYTFATVSGQKIGPEKSMLWFSKATGDEIRARLAQIMMVPIDAKADFYLGAPILTGRVAYDFLIEKVSSRLQIWKSRVLSQTGRLVVIKSVLQAIPVY